MNPKNTGDLHENIIFGYGEISIFNVSLILIPTNSFIMFSQSFSDIFNTEELLYSIGKIEGEILYKSFGTAHSTDKIFDFVEYAGLGHFEIIVSQKNHHVIKSDKCPLTDQQLKFGTRKSNSISYVLGIFVGYLQAKSGITLGGSEIQCVLKGNAQCNFTIAPSKILPLEIELKDMIKNKDFLYNTKITSKHNAIIEKALQQNHLILEQGEIKLWNFSTTFIPITSLLLYERYILKKYGKEIAKRFYYIGKKQAYSASGIQIQQYGRKNDYKLFLSMFEHHDLIGCGQGKVIKFDEENKSIELESNNNTYLKFNFNLFGEVTKVNNYLAGLTGGITTAYLNDNMQSDELNPSKDKCFFKLYQNKIIYPKIIEELANTLLTVKALLK